MNGPQQPNFSQAFNHLEKDPVMAFLIETFGNDITLLDRYESDHALALAQLIIEQQVSFKAAITIKGRFLEKIEGKTAQDIAQMDREDLKSIGISYRKVDYIQNVYRYFLDHSPPLEQMSGQDIIKALTQIKGIGRWTVEMFLIFVKGDRNIFSEGDLALINSIKINYNEPELKGAQIKKFTQAWDPFNTIASLLLWKSIEEKVYYNAEKQRHK